MIEGYSEEEKNNGTSLHFYYNHEERIKNAPKIVQDYYAGKLMPTKGLFKILVANKFNRFMLFSVAFCFVVVLIVNFLTSSSSLGVCAGFECELSAFTYDGEVYAQIRNHALKKSLKNKKFKLDDYIEDQKEAAAIFNFINSDQEIGARMQKSVLLQKNDFFLRTSAPDYDIIEVRAQIEILGERIELKAKVKKQG